MSFAWRMRGALDKKALSDAIGMLIRRHEALRTTYKILDGAPVQVVGEAVEFVLPEESLVSL